MKKDEEIKDMAITPGNSVKVEAPTRKEASAKVAELIKQAAEQGLDAESGGFVHQANGIFIAELIFIKRQ